MANKKQVANEVEELTMLKDMVQAFEEIAVSRMKKIRTSVLQNRDFLGGITHVFQEVKTSYKNDVVLLLKKKKLKEKNKPNPKGTSTRASFALNSIDKTLCVLMSANTGLYGDILQKTFKLFMEYVNAHDRATLDIMVMGALGRRLFELENPGVPYTYFDFPSDTISEEALRKIIDFILKYERIMLFYGKFQSIVTQSATMLDMYGNQEQEVESTRSASFDQTQDKRSGQAGAAKIMPIKYFFEPSLENVMSYFESEIFATIFNQSVYEFNLAKLGSRISNLDTSIENMKTSLKHVELEQRILKHREMNKKQNGALSGMSLWSK